MKQALASTLVVAAVATLGDWVWATFLSRHVMVAGLVHGMLLCLAMGAVLGLPARRPAAGALAGALVGAASAGMFYALAPLLRYAAMFAAWFALWLLLSAAQHVMLRQPHAWTETLLRGIVAGLASGAAFYAVSDMWTAWNPQTIDYAGHFARWAFAFAPGFLALQVRRPSRVRV